MEVKLLKFDEIKDNRGALVAIEGNKNIPFGIKRIYYIYGANKNTVRGKHAHRDLNQILICISGSCKILLDDGNEATEILLDRPNLGLFIGGMTWREMFNFTEDCTLMILADEYYNKNEYIRDYSEFRKIKHMMGG